VRARSPESLVTWAEGVSLFWHLVDVIWLFVFATIWLLQ
jgi:heme/copper-type cytochrome/quinol oxidase subunit 3